MTRAKFYFEGHVTIKPVTGELRQAAINVARRYGYREASFLQREDGPEASEAKGFFSTRGSVDDRVKGEMIEFVKELARIGVEVTRYKIEDTVLDSDLQGDVLRTNVSTIKRASHPDVVPTSVL